MKTKIYVSTANPAANYVMVETDDLLTGERCIVEYFAPVTGGYVRVADKNFHFPQVCDGLSGAGNTLSWSGKTPFIDLIRREHKNGRAALKRILNK